MVLEQEAEARRIVLQIILIMMNAAQPSRDARAGIVLGKVKMLYGETNLALEGLSSFAHAAFGQAGVITTQETARG